MRLPAPAWTLVLQLCPHAGAHDGVGGLRGKQGVGDKASLAAGRAGAAQPAVRALGSIQGDQVGRGEAALTCALPVPGFCCGQDFTPAQRFQVR